MSSPATEFYITGGTLQRDAPCYVIRQADSDLLAGLIQRKFCYVLTSRQMGKSSLMVRTAVRLREEGCGVAILDLTAIGQNLNATQWYRGLLSQMGQQLELEDELIEFWRESHELGPLQRWIRAIREVILPRYHGPLVIFVDEIDAVRSLPFSTDEFFAAIREFYNRRTEDEELERLTFCLLGVATPSDLIRDTRTTPFNIGERIELHDFNEDEAASLAQGLKCEKEAATAILKRIHYWTGGHPYLTQRLCQAVAETNPQAVDRLCGEQFFSPRAQERDDNLLFVRERMLRSEADLAGLLHLYEQVHRRKRVHDDETNPLVTALRLSGIARVENGLLRRRNRIYARIFNRAWVKANMPDAELRRQKIAFRRGLLRAAAVAAVIFAVMAVLVWFAIEQRNHAIEQEAVNRRLLYAARMNLAQQAWESIDLGRMRELLTQYIPRPGEEDMRGFEWRYLWHLCNGNVFARHQDDPVLSLAFSPDSARLATAGDNNFVKIWETSTGKELIALKGHTDKIRSVTYSPDGSKLASAGDDRTVKLWDAATGNALATFKGHTNIVNLVVFSPDGKILAAGSRDNTAKIWDIATGQEIATLRGHVAGVSSVAFSPDGDKLATGSYDASVKLWDPKTGREIKTFKRYPRQIQCVVFSPDGASIAVGGWDGTVRLWSVATGKERVVFNGQAGHIRSIAFSPDGKKLAAAGEGRVVNLWDVATGKELTIFKRNADIITSVAFSPDGSWLAAGCIDRTVKLWSVAAKQEATIDKTILEGVWSVAFSPGGAELATGSADHSVKIWEANTGRLLRTFQGHKDVIGSVAFSPDGAKLATVSGDHTVKIWDMVTGKELITLEGQGRVFTVAFSPDGRRLATGSSDHTVKIRDVSDWRELATLKGHTDVIWSVAFSPDGASLASGSSDRTIKLWNVASGNEVATLKGHTEIVNSVAFSPDGKSLASGSNDRTIKLWDVVMGKEIASLKGHANAIVAVKYSPDGSRLATGGADHTIKLWEVNRGIELITLKGHSKVVWSLAFTPDGSKLASGSEDGTVKLWYATPDNSAYQSH